MRDDLYSNTSESSRQGGGWVYMNGELYHYGRKGMKWYETIFGGYDNPKSMTYDPNFGKSNGDIQTNKWNLNSKKGRKNAWNYVKGTGRTALNSIRSGSAAKNFNKYYIRGTQKDVYDKYLNNRKENAESRKNQNKNGASYLDRFENKQIDDAYKVKAKGGNSIFKSINLAIQNAEYDVAKGINNFLKQNKWDDEVDDFLSMIFGRSEYNKNRKGQGPKKNMSGYTDRL